MVEFMLDLSWKGMTKWLFFYWSKNLLSLIKCDNIFSLLIKLKYVKLVNCIRCNTFLWNNYC